MVLLDDTEEEVNLDCDFLLLLNIIGDSMMSCEFDDEEEEAVGEADVGEDVKLLESLEQHSSIVVVVSIVVDSAPPLCDRFVSYSHIAVLLM